MPFVDPLIQDNSYEGTFPAIIIRVSPASDVFTESGFVVGMASQVFYDVQINMPDGPLFFTGVTPDHLRPSMQTLIIAARPNDECEARLRGGTFKFVIHESVYSIDCSTP